MGCRSSKAEATTVVREPCSSSSLVELCRNRCKLISEAVELRFALAAAHVAYFEALVAVGDALKRFVDEELVAEASSDLGSPVITLPPSSKVKGVSGEESGGSAVSLASSVTPLSHSLSFDGGSHIDISPEGSHLPISSSPESEDGIHGGDAEAPNGVGASPGSPRNWRSISPNYMRTSSMAIPTMVFEDPFMNYSGFGYGDEFGQQKVGPSVAPGTPPPPSPPRASGWDFFDPFNSYETELPDYYKDRYDGSGFIASPDLNEVRRQEGIPELEEELEVDVVNEVKGKGAVEDEVKVDAPKESGGVEKRVSDVEVVEDGVSDKRVSDAKKENGVSEKRVGDKGVIESEIKVPAPKENADGEKRVGDDGSVHSVGKVSSSSSRKSKSRSSGDDEGSYGRRGVTFEDVSLVREDTRTSHIRSLSETSGEQPLSSLGTRDVVEVVNDLKEQFEHGAACGEEVSKMLEVGKLQYHHKSRTEKILSSMILNPMNLSLLSISHPSFRQSSTSKPNITESEVCDDIKSHNLSTTLEKLSVWEEKLYKEVKDEEKLRLDYERRYKKLRRLDQNGAEPSKIHSTRVSVKELSTKISIVIKSVDTISRKMHRIRDEELQPQFTKLIKGFIRMWKTLVYCHKKQLQAILSSKGDHIFVKIGKPKKDVGNATYELEREILNWYHCFKNWINIQKLFIKSLNGWLLKWLPDEQEKTSDGDVPFSPSRLQAPTVFIISNDLSHVIKTIRENQVNSTMEKFIKIIHVLGEFQKEESRQRLEKEHLSITYNRKLKSILERGMDEHLVIVSSNHGGQQESDKSRTALDLLKQKLDEKIEQHRETVRKLYATSNSLPAGLIPLFESLENFTRQVVKSYNSVRIPDGGGK